MRVVLGVFTLLERIDELPVPVVLRRRLLRRSDKSAIVRLGGSPDAEAWTLDLQRTNSSRRGWDGATLAAD